VQAVVATVLVFTFELQSVVRNPLPDVGFTGVQLATNVVVLAELSVQVVVTKLALVPGVQLATAVGPEVKFGQVVATKLLAKLAAIGVQLATGVGPVVLAVGHCVATKPLAEDAAIGVHDATGAVIPLVVWQARVSQELPEFAVCGLQLATSVGPVTMGLQVVLVNPLPDDGPDAVHVCTGTVAEATGQVVVVQLLLKAAAVARQLAGNTAVGPVLTGVQVVAINELALLAAAGMQLAAAAGPLKICVLHVLLTNEFPGAAACGVQDATKVGPVLLVEQVRFKKEFPLLPI
jgi:hypothetical protein